MATREELIAALRKADAAGATEDATRLASAIRGMDTQPTGAPEADTRIPSPQGELTAVAGVELDDEMRAALQSEDDNVRRLMTARIAGISAARDANREGAIGRTFLESAASGFFGLGDVISAGVGAMQNDLSFTENLEAERAFRGELERLNPKTGLAGQVTGTVAGGGVLGATAKRAGVGLARGAVKSNLVKILAGGAIEGAAIEAGREGREEAGKGALLGAAGAGVGTGVVKLGAAAFNAAKRTYTKEAVDGILSRAPGLKGLAKKIGEAPEELARRFQAFKDTFGRPPSMSEILNPQSAREIADDIALQPAAAQILREGVGEQTVRRGAEAADIVRGRATPSVAALARRRGNVMDQALNAIEDQNVAVAKDLLDDPDLLPALPRGLRRRVNDVIDEAGDGGADIPIRMLDDIRQALGAAAGDGKGAKQVFLELKDEITDAGRTQIPAYGRALDEFGQRSEAIRGVGAGRKATTAAPEDVAEAVAQGTPRATVGQRIGARSEIAKGFGGKHPAGVANNLLTNNDLTANLSKIMKPEEVAKLKSLAEQTMRATDSEAVLRPGTRSAAMGEGAELAAEAVGATGFLTGASGPTAQASFTARILETLQRRLPGRSEKVLSRMARDVLDPEKTEAVIRAMKKAGASDKDITDLYAFALGGGVGTTTGE